MRKPSNLPLPGLKPLMEGRKVGYVAEQVGIDQGTFSGLISGKRAASLATALKLARYFKTTVESLAEERQTASV